MAVEPNHYAPESASVKLQDCLVLLSARAVATVNTNTSTLMHIFHQYNIFMKILSTIRIEKLANFPEKVFKLMRFFFFAIQFYGARTFKFLRI